MWADPEFLALCQDLSRRGALPPAREGAVLARAFADLGFEEFALLPGGKILSLLNGEASDLSNGRDASHFLVPTAEDLTQEIAKRYHDIVSLIFEQQRTWVLAVKHCRSLTERLFRGKTIESAMARALLHIVSES